MKKGQLAFFVIGGITILILTIVMTYYLSQENFNPFEKFTTSRDAKEINNHLESCIKQNSITAFSIIGMQAGYMNIPEDYYYIEFLKIPYNYYKNKKTLPSKDEIKRSVGGYLSNNLNDCLEDEKYNKYQYETKNAKIDITLNLEEIIVNVKYPVEIISENQRHKLEDDYSIKIPIKFGMIYDLVETIIEKGIEDSENIPLSNLMNSGFEVEVIPDEEGKEIIYLIKDDSLKFEGEPYIYMFANKF